MREQCCCYCCGLASGIGIDPLRCAFVAMIVDGAGPAGVFVGSVGCELV